MKLIDVLFETQILSLCKALFEKQNPEAAKDEQNNNIVKSWAKKLDMSYDELHAVWDKAKEKVGSDTNYFAIVGAFKKMVTSLKGVTKKELQDGGNAKFGYKVRTQQSMDQLMDDKPAPKSVKPGEVKKTKAKMSDINAKMREIKLKPNNTPAQKERNKKALEELRAKKKELQDSIK
jgi:hypothetical protein